MKKLLRNYLTENEQKILLFIIFFAFLGLVIKFSGLLAEDNSTPAYSLNFQKDYEIKYDLRTVTKKELVTISGIGEKRATDIISYRDKIGFYSKEDLMNVKGIGEATYTKIEKYFHNIEIENAKDEISEPETESAVNPEKININKAGLEELTKLPGIGPLKAARIIELRKELGKYKTIDDLLQVKGIGPKTLEKFKEQIILGE
ncbi:MAG: ComEA family DNA-binding protein [Candidatus Cloacimonetes bacterium]|nr:ComEA family DNA-binding protein [Candidatus Cloacimonadota bacterium]